MSDKNKYVIEERPKSEVFITEHNYIAIRQIDRNDESTILFTVPEAEEIIVFMKKCVETLRLRARE